MSIIGPNAIPMPNLAHRFAVTFLEFVNGAWSPITNAEVLTSQVVACRVLNDVARPAENKNTTEVSVIIEDDAANKVHKTIFQEPSGLTKNKNSLAIGISYLNGDNKILRQTTYLNVALDTVQESDLNYGITNSSATSRTRITLPVISNANIPADQLSLLNLIYKIVDGATVDVETPGQSSFYDSLTHQFRLVFSVNPKDVKTVYLTDSSEIEESRK